MPFLVNCLNVMLIPCLKVINVKDILNLFLECKLIRFSIPPFGKHFKNCFLNTDLRRNGDGKYIDELLDPGYTLGSINGDSEEVLLQRGIDLSLSKTPAEAIRRQREQFLKRFQTDQPVSQQGSDSVIRSPSNVTDVKSSTTVNPSNKL